MNFISSEKEFSDTKKEIGDLLYLEKDLSKQVFKGKPEYFFFLEELELLQGENAFESLQLATEIRGNSYFLFILLDPSPESYYEEFKLYPFFHVYRDTTYESYRELLTEEFTPKVNLIVTEIQIVWNKVVVYSSSMDWLIYIDRDFEIGILGIMEKNLIDLFRKTYKKDRLFPVKEALDILIDMVFRGKIPRKIKKQFIKNHNN